MNNNNLVVEHIPPNSWWGRSRYKLVKAVNILGLDIPEDFISDGATAPRFLWTIVPPMGKHTKATFYHDCMLEILFDLGEVSRSSVLKINNDFRQIMINDNVPKYMANIIYWFVRAYWFVKMTWLQIKR